MADEKPSTTLSILGALLALGGLPVGVVLFALFAQGEVSQLWAEGGWGMYAAFVLGGLACLVSAVGVFFAPRGVPAVLGAALAAIVAMVATSSFAWRSMGLASLEAISHASPLDRAIIMRGALSELDSLTLLSSSLAGGLFLALGLGVAAAALATRVPGRRGGLAFAAAGLVVLGGWQALSASGTAGERQALAAASHASPMDKTVLMLDGFERLATGRKAGAGALLGALVLAFAGAAALRAHRQAMAGVLAAVLVPIAGVGGLGTLARPTLPMLTVATAPDLSAPLIELDAAAIDLRDVHLVLTPGVDEFDAAALARSNPLGLGLQKGNEAAVLELLRTAQLAPDAMVTLVGQKQIETPAFVPAEWKVLFVEPRGLTFRVTSDASSCAARCVAGRLTEKGLEADGEVWPLADQSSSPFPAGEVSISLEGLTVPQLIRVAHAAAAHDRRVVLVRPAP